MALPRSPGDYEIWRDDLVTAYVEPAALAGWEREGVLAFHFGMFGTCTLRLDRSTDAVQDGPTNGEVIR